MAYGNLKGKRNNISGDEKSSPDKGRMLINSDPVILHAGLRNPRPLRYRQRPLNDPRGNYDSLFYDCQKLLQVIYRLERLTIAKARNESTIKACFEFGDDRVSDVDVSADLDETLTNTYIRLKQIIDRIEHTAGADYHEFQKKIGGFSDDELDHIAHAKRKIFTLDKIDAKKPQNDKLAKWKLSGILKKIDEQIVKTEQAVAHEESALNMAAARIKAQEVALQYTFRLYNLSPAANTEMKSEQIAKHVPGK